MLFDLQATDKEGVINEMVQSLVDNGVVTDFDTFKAGIMNREAQTSTGLVTELLCPIAKKWSSKKSNGLVCQIKQGCGLCFTGWSTNRLVLHDRSSRRSKRHSLGSPCWIVQVMKPDLRTNFAKQVLLIKWSQPWCRRARSCSWRSEKSRSSQRSGFIGQTIDRCRYSTYNRIAHTYMAKKPSSKKGEEMGVTVRVETNGASGCRQPLDSWRNRQSWRVIIAADKAVETARSMAKKIDL